MHIKHRPRTFEEVIGNKAVVEALQKRSDSNPLLFQGERGSGKSSVAHIVANSFGATKENIIVRNCRDMSAKEMSEFLSTLRNTSLFGKNKVVVFEEIHGLHVNAQEKLLVPLDGENTDRLPDNIQVIACTTEPNKIQPTLYDRFKKFTLKSLNNRDALTLIESISKKEGIDLEAWAKSLLLESCGGNPRRLLVGLDTIRNCSSKEHAEELLEIVKIEEDKDLLELFKILLAKQDWSVVRKILGNILKSKNPNEIRVGLMNLVGANMMSKYYKPENSRYLTQLFDSLIKANNIPEKACLINALHNQNLKQ